MDVQEILSHLERNEGHFPKAAIQEAIARREEVIPALLDVLADVARHPEPFASDGDRMVHLYAMFLLAQFRETRAYPLLVKIFSAAGELPFDLAGDVLTDDLGRILAFVSDGDVGGITSLVENERANEYVRSAAMDGLLTLVACGKRSRDEVMAYFGRLFHTLDRTPSMVWDGLADSCADLCPEEVVEDIRRAYEEDLIEPRFIAWEDIEQALAVGKEAALERLPDRFSLIADVVKDMGWWSCFRENAWRAKPLLRAQPKVGRNDPCPCGSGKKFKKCCGGKEAQAGNPASNL